MHIRITFHADFYKGRIEAIKILRALTGAGLKASKDAIDSITRLDAAGNYTQEVIGTFVAKVDPTVLATALLDPPRRPPQSVKVEALTLPSTVFDLT